MNNRILRASRLMLGLLPFLGFCMVLLGPISTGAVESIRNISWDSTPSILTKPSLSKAHASFEAQLSSRDLSMRTTSLSAMLIHPDGTPETICRYMVYGTTGNCGGPVAGTTAVVDLEFTMTCDPSRSQTEVVCSRATMTYTDRSGWTIPVLLSVEQLRTTTSSQESFGIAILDENGVVGAETSPEEFSCTDTDPGANGSIGIYFDSQGTVCQGSIPAGSACQVWILAKLSGATAAGLGAAEFRVTGLPASWQADVQLDPQVISIGDPFGDGVAMGITRPPSENGTLLLYEVTVTATSDEHDVRLEIGMRTPPSNPLGQCPLLVACDEPVFTQYCVDTASCFINPRTSAPCGNPVAVEQLTWSGVKDLFR